MLLIKFLNNLFKINGFLLEDAHGREHVIGKPKSKNPIKMKMHDHSLWIKLFSYKLAYLTVFWILKDPP